MPSNITYVITMGTGLALSPDSSRSRGSQLVLANRDDGNALQRWSWVFYPTTQSSVLYHPELNMFAAPTNLNQGAGVVLYPMNEGEFDGTNTWQIGQGSFIRPPQNQNLNLNAFGDTYAAGTKVGIWSWGGGAQNEVWTNHLILPQ